MSRCPQYTAPGNRPVRDGDRSLHRARLTERRRGHRGRRVVRRQRIGVEHVAVEAIADLVDGLAPHELGHPEVAAHHVVQERPDAPVVAHRVGVELARRRSPPRRRGSDRGHGRGPRAGRRPSGTSSHGGDGRDATRTGGRVAAARPRQHSPSMKIQDRRWIALGPYAAQRGLVDRRRVPDVRLEVVRRVVLGLLVHERVAGDLGDAPTRRRPRATDVSPLITVVTRSRPRPR